jgi:hypothetical protein
VLVIDCIGPIFMSQTSSQNSIFIVRHTRPHILSDLLDVTSDRAGDVLKRICIVLG